MKYFNKVLLIFTASFIILSSCKLDKPVLPADNGNIPNAYNDETVLGITVQGRAINDPYLTSLWKTSKTIQQLYDTGNVVVSGFIVPNKFTTVSLNDQSKTAQYTGFPANLATATYELSTSNNVLYIKLTPDPFFNSLKKEVRITQLTSSSMIWVALDTTATLLGGKYFHKGYQMIFTK